MRCVNWATPLRPQKPTFILVQDPANAALRWLASHGVQVKDTRQFGLADHMRISIGLVEDNDLLLTLLADYATQQQGD